MLTMISSARKLVVAGVLIYTVDGARHGGRDGNNATGDLTSAKVRKQMKEITEPTCKDRLLGPNERATQKQWSDRLDAERERNGFIERWECPWLSIPINKGCIYSSICTTGKLTWVSLAMRIIGDAAPDRPDIAVLTGRHGAILNQMTDERRTPVFDPRHTREDTMIFTELHRQDWAAGANFELIDVSRIPGADTGDTTRDHAKHLRVLINRLTSQGKHVILAWCFSAFCYSEIPNNVSYKHFAENNNRQIAEPLCAIVEKYWLNDFVPDEFLGNYAPSDFAPEGQGRAKRESNLLKLQLKEQQKQRQEEEREAMIAEGRRLRDTQQRQNRVVMPNMAQHNAGDVDAKIRKWAKLVKSQNWSRDQLGKRLEKPSGFPPRRCPEMVPYIDRIMQAAA